MNSPSSSVRTHVVVSTTAFASLLLLIVSFLADSRSVAQSIQGSFIGTVTDKAPRWSLPRRSRLQIWMKVPFARRFRAAPASISSSMQRLGDIPWKYLPRALNDGPLPTLFSRRANNSHRR